jgi:CTP synthase
VPSALKKEGLDELILKKLNIKLTDRGIKNWEEGVLKRLRSPAKEVKIAVVGKYISLQDAYKSIYEALAHGGIANNARVSILKIDSEEVEGAGFKKYLKDAQGVLIPGGFGARGIEGKIAAVKYVRENNIPFFGICLGMQIATIEFARNVTGLKGANSTEFDKETSSPVISLIEEQKKVKNLGASMRLGAYSCVLEKGTRSFEAYKNSKISERHRHRYEFNNTYRQQLTQKGLVIAGLNPERDLVEIIEIKDHPWFVGCQFHPEFKSKPDSAHPLFRGFIAAALNHVK